MVLGDLTIRKFIHKVKQFISDRIVRNAILKLVQDVPNFNRLIKKIEEIRGLYIYPKRILGRNLKISPNSNHTDVLVFAAHPDDDILGLGTTLYRHSLNGDHIKVAFVTNGSAGAGESWFLKADKSIRRANLRYREAAEALSEMNIAKENIYCLGFPDGGTQRYLKPLSMDIAMLIKKFNPQRVYVHCIEGGHIDHDMTSFIVKYTCKKIGYTNLFEWAEYNPSQPMGTQKIRFLPGSANQFAEKMIDISKEERMLKKKMLAFHKSQGVENCYLQGEAIRQAAIDNPDKELYEHCQISKRRLLPIINEFYNTTDGGFPSDNLPYYRI